MKVFIDYSIRDCGKSKFLGRLVRELETRGVFYSSDPRRADIALLISRPRGPLPPCPKVIRMDGIDLLDTPRNRHKVAHVVLPAMNECQGVIYQSRFCQTVLNAIIRHSIPEERQFVIYNAAHPREFDVEPMKSPYPWNILLCAQWFKKQERVYKRLGPLFEFINDYCHQCKDTMFWVAGATNPATKLAGNDRVRILGNLTNRELLPVLRMADVYLHMPEFSWCDNSLVECVCAGCYPIGSNIGGNAEVIMAVGGGVVDGDQPRKLGWIREYVPAPLNRRGLEKALTFARTAPPINCEEVHISRAADHYLNVFHTILKGWGR